MHGLGGSHLNWDRIAEPLTALGRVVAVDLPGFGVNPLDGDADVARYAAMVLDFAQQYFDTPPVLVGNSMGGLVSLLATQQSPELVDRLVLISPALPPRAIHFYTTTAQLLLRTTPVIGDLITRRAYRRYSMAELTDLAYENICADPTVVPPEMRERSIRLAEWRKDTDWAIPAFSEASQSILRRMLKPGWYRKLLTSIEPPTLLIHGDRDRVVQPAAAIWAASVRPDWQFVLLENVGHVPMIERPEVVVGLIAEFVARQPDQSLSA